MPELSEILLLIFNWLDGIMTYDGVMRGFTEVNPFIINGFNVFGFVPFLVLARFVLPIYAVYILKKIKHNTGKEMFKTRAVMIGWAGVFPVTWNLLVNICR